MKPDVKKIIITDLPYLLFVWLFGKVGEAWQLAAGHVRFGSNMTKELIRQDFTINAAVGKESGCEWP